MMVSTDFKTTTNYYCCHFRFSLTESNQVRESGVLVMTDVVSTTSAISLYNTENGKKT